MPMPYEIRAAGTEQAELLIYGNIGDTWWDEGVTAKAVVEELQGLDVGSIVVRVNSYGGAVSDGLAIYNALRRHRAHVTVRIDGVAVSIASLIAMAGDTVEIAENAMFMVHAPWGGLYGNSKELREYADLLDKYAEAMASSYARKTGKSHEEILALLTDGEDHWYTGPEAHAEGFADAVVEEVAIAASGFARSRFVASGLRNAAEALKQVAADVRLPKQPAAQVAAHPTHEHEEPNMPQATNPATQNPAASPEVNAAEVEARVRAAEKQRREGIRSAFQPFSAREGVPAVLDACLDDCDVTVEQARAQLLDVLGRESAPLATGGRVEAGESEHEKFARGAQAAIMTRATLARDDSTNEFRSYSLVEMARRSLAMHGISTGRMDKMALVAAAFTHSSSDFGNVLANVASKAMLKGAEEAEETFQRWTAVGELPDFKPSSRIDLDAFPSLRQVREGAEYKYATIGDRGEQIQLATYGELFSITRQAIINDDLSMFTRIPQKMGRAAIRTIGDLVYAILLDNPAMSDGTALFHADHKNLLTAAGISTSSVDAMRVAMATQKAPGSEASLGIRLASLLVPVALEGAANVTRNSEFEVGATNRNNTVPNSVRDTFEVIADARLDVNGSKAWFGVANGGLHDTVEVAYLEGNQMPTLEQQNGWSVDGVEFKVRVDAGVKALDFKTMAKNPG